jgi:hypothetical protein
MESNNLTYSLKKLLKIWICSSTVHGLPNMFKSENKCLTLTWFMCFLISSTLCSLVVIKRIVEYSKFEVVSRMQMAYEIPTQFPSVTICNNFPFKTKESMRFLKQVLDQNNLTGLNANMFGIDPKVNVKIAKYLSDLNALNPHLNDSYRQSFGLTRNEMLLSCFYNTIACLSDDSFENFYHPRYGNCFRFNSGRQADILQSVKSGKLNGLQFELFIGANEALEFDFMNFERGAQILISNQTINLNSLDGISVATGKSTNIILRRQFTNKLSFPYSDCKKNVQTFEKSDPFLYKELLKANQTYRFDDCVRLCLQMKLIEKCDCFDSNFLRLFNSRPCLTLSDVMCALDIFNSFFNQYNLEECSKYCPRECDSQTFLFELHSIDFPSSAYGQLLMKNSKILSKFGNSTLNIAQLKESVLSVNIYYDDFYYNVMDEVEKTSLFEVIGGIGGVLGLFLGISFLSFIELIDVIIQIVVLFRAHFKQKQ